MCELLGMSFNLPVRPRISFTGFQRRGEQNPHGWGLAFYPDESVQVFKEPIKATKSPLSEFLRDYKEIKSKIFIAHVRYITKGIKSYKNTHPFFRELNAKAYVFAHNGDIANYSKLKLGRYKPIGETDSEHVFCHILDCIDNKSITEWDKQGFQWLSERLSAINNLGTFNCLCSDSRHLFCYFDKQGHNGLYFIHREPPYGQIRLKDKDWEVNLAEEKDPGQRGFIVATRPLTNESWEKFMPGELAVFKDGRIVYSNSRNVEKFPQRAEKRLELHVLKLLRESQHRVSLKKIISQSECNAEEIKMAVKLLLEGDYILQYSRDNVQWNRNDATFYTNSSKREEIDRIIGG